MRIDLARKALQTHMMTDRCRITVDPESVEGVLNEETFEVEYPPGALIYQGPCKLVAAAANRQSTGHELSAIDQLTLTLPHSTTGLKVGQIVVMTSSADPMLNNQGITFEISRVLVGTHQLSRTVEIERRSAIPTSGGE